MKSWLYDTHKYEVQISSFEVNETMVRVHLISFFQSPPLVKITTYDINQLYAQKLNDGLANATVKKIHNLVYFQRQ
ncbi:hypothetical protein [Metabacillus fastidiosus]|uniref:hypothetical protein n=1 Tax=Metabacillus fastidiosus TaxID=1458 RepID=UPI003D2BDFD6